MKHIVKVMLLLAIIGRIGALDTESYQFIDHLLTLSGPKAPEIYEDAVIFTAPSSYRRVGIAFAHEGFAKVHWFKKLMSSGNGEAGAGTSGGGTSSKQFSPYRDSGILFHVQEIPPGTEELEYRLIIDGLWTSDPLNPLRRIDRNSGILRSLVQLPRMQKDSGHSEALYQGLRLNYSAPPGEIITVAGSFNRWDPFMYEMQEQAPGQYSLTIPLPPGTYQYTFYRRGERILDPANPNRVYTSDGKIASETTLP